MKAPIPATHNIPEYTVSEISNSIKRSVEENFTYVRVRGEISGYKRAPSGHCYLNLKDDKSVLAAVCWKGMADKLTCKMEDGLEVTCSGRITTFPGQSKYQMIIEYVEPAGAGALMALLEKRKKQLAAEGLFDASRKKPLPKLPETIGIITSPTGAVIRDILHRLADRFPRHVLLWPVLVQGEQAAKQVAEAIHGFNNLTGTTIKRPDLLIVARGGGSLEDLWAFNEEIVVRAAAASNIPLISAIGHETDTTLIDYAADVRAPTPTAAAELAVPVRAELLLGIHTLKNRMLRGMLRSLDEKNHKLKSLERGLPRPASILEQWQQRLDITSTRLQNAFPALFSRKQQRLQVLAASLKDPGHQLSLSGIQLQHLAGRLAPVYTRKLERLGERIQLASKLLESYHYKKVLQRGFALVRDNSNQLITTARQAKTKTLLSIEFQDGIAETNTQNG